MTDHLSQYNIQISEGWASQGVYSSRGSRWWFTIYSSDEVKFNIASGNEGGHFDISTDPETNEGILNVIKINASEGGYRYRGPFCRTPDNEVGANRWSMCSEHGLLGLKSPWPVRNAGLWILSFLPSWLYSHQNLIWYSRLFLIWPVTLTFNSLGLF